MELEDIRAARQGDHGALERLAESKALSRGRLFAPQRWAILEPAFGERQGDRPFREAWRELVASNLVPALAELDGAPPDRLYWKLRARLRAEVERDLLGMSADELVRHPVEPLPDGETWEEEEGPKRRLDPALVFDPWLQIDQRIDLELALRELDPQTRRALELHAWDGLNLREAARKVGITYPALKQRLYRLRKRWG